MLADPVPMTTKHQEIIESSFPNLVNLNAEGVMDSLVATGIIGLKDLEVPTL